MGAKRIMTDKANGVGRKILLPKEIWQLIYGIAQHAEPHIQKKFLRLTSNRSKYQYQECEDGTTLKYKVLDMRAALQCCNLLGISVRDVFQKAGYALPWGIEDGADLDKMLCSLPTDALLKLKAVAESFVPQSWVVEEKKLSANPTIRANWVILNRNCSPSERAALIQDIIQADPNSNWGTYKKYGIAAVERFSHHNYAAISLKQLFFLATKVEMPSTWFWGYADGETAILSESPNSEYILARYSAMSNQSKKTFRQILNTVANEKEAG